MLWNPTPGRPDEYFSRAIQAQAVTYLAAIAKAVCTDGQCIPCANCLQVNGDAFIGRTYDNGDDFKRLDFTVSEVSSSAPWVQVRLLLTCSNAIVGSANPLYHALSGLNVLGH